MATIQAGMPVWVLQCTGEGGVGGLPGAAGAHGREGGTSCQAESVNPVSCTLPPPIPPCFPREATYSHQGVRKFGRRQCDDPVMTLMDVGLPS